MAAYFLREKYASSLHRERTKNDLHERPTRSSLLGAIVEDRII